LVDHKQNVDERPADQKATAAVEEGEDGTTIVEEISTGDEKQTDRAHEEDGEHSILEHLRVAGYAALAASLHADDSKVRNKQERHDGA